MLENNINVRIQNFDGPLGLLLHLIQEEQMSIKDLDITQITGQYLAYLKKMQDLNFDIAGDYLYMAATLLFIKSKFCVEEEEQTKKLLKGEEDFQITSKSELIRKLEELARFQKLGERLWGLNKKGHEIFTKPKINRKDIINSILTPMELDNLTEVMIDFIKREKRKYTVVRRDRISIKEKLKTLKERLSSGTKTDFEQLLDKDKSIDDIVITFISLLELARLKKIELFQNESFGNIYVDVVEDLNNFDVETADGFEDEEELENKKLEMALATNIDGQQEMPVQ